MQEGTSPRQSRRPYEERHMSMSKQSAAGRRAVLRCVASGFGEGPGLMLPGPLSSSAWGPCIFHLGRCYLLALAAPRGRVPSSGALKSRQDALQLYAAAISGTASEVQSKQAGQEVLLYSSPRGLLRASSPSSCREVLLLAAHKPLLRWWVGKQNAGTRFRANFFALVSLACHRWGWWWLWLGQAQRSVAGRERRTGRGAGAQIEHGTKRPESLDDHAGTCAVRVRWVLRRSHKRGETCVRD